MPVKKSTKTLDKLENVSSALSSEINSNNIVVAEAAMDLIKAACKKIGMGLDDYLLAVKNGLTANRVTLDKYGEEHTEADHLVRLKAATMGLEVEGYLRKGISTGDGSGNTYVLQINNILKELGIKSATSVVRKTVSAD